jgi:hypothetical protein
MATRAPAAAAVVNPRGTAAAAAAARMGRGGVQAHQQCARRPAHPHAVRVPHQRVRRRPHQLLAQ